ncbi:MAG: metallophosphoesterase family protein [Burkholderiales bacterium]|nr:metallophosphoesterase family protein [Burkholderiales bacterium]
MRIAVLSDIHGNLPALEAVLAEVAAAAVDLVVNLGDTVSGPLWPAETAARLMALGWPTIAGNHERQVLTLPRERLSPTDAHTAPLLAAEQRAWLAALPPIRWLDDEVFCCHGTPASDLQYLMETVTPDHSRGGAPGVRAASADELAQRLAGLGPRVPRLLLCGHTHQPRLRLWGETLLLNPGSVGLQAYDDLHPHPHRIEQGSPHARWALAEREVQGQWRIEQHMTPYDWQAAAAQAERHGRPDWADALRTGLVGRTEQEIFPR